jgi:hypothetical protein
MRPRCACGHRVRGPWVAVVIPRLQHCRAGVERARQGRRPFAQQRSVSGLIGQSRRENGQMGGRKLTSYVGEVDNVVR